MNLVSLEAGGGRWRVDPRKGSRKVRSLEPDPSAGQANFHNIPAGPCSRLKASRRARPVSKLLSTWPDISCPGWFHGPRTHMAIHCCTLRRTPCLVSCSIGASLTKALPFHQPLGPPYHVAGPACGTDSEG